MKSERIAALLAKKTGRLATPGELEELEQLLAADPDAAFAAAVINDIGQPGSDAGEEAAFAAAGWEQLEPALQPARKRRAAVWWAAAASVLLAAASVAIWQRSSRTPGVVATAMQQITAPMGKTIKAQLPDGSLVWLNAGSTLSYDAGFARTNRNVSVTGEIFLDVTKDEANPFIVHTSNLDVHVLGTSFNIKAYEDDKRSEVTVIGGKVQVIMRNSPEKKVVLLPHEKLVLAVLPTAARKTATGEHVSFQVQGLAGTKDSALVMETAWRDQKLAFMNETFEEVTRKMERQFNVTITIEDDHLKNEILSGVFEKEDISKALQLLQMITPFHYRIEQEHIYLSR